MSAFDYGNARLRGMKSRLLTRRDLENLTGASSIAGLIAALTKTAYRKPIEFALARTTGMECINEALRADLVNTLGKIRNYYNERAGEMVSITLRPYDLHNITAILRGLGNAIAPGKILDTLVPVGELDLHTLTSLSRAPGLRAAVDMIVSMHLPFGLPLLRLRAEQPGAGLLEMEMTLQCWHFQQAMDYASGIPDSEWFKAAINLEADLINLRTALRFVHAPNERETINQQNNAQHIYNLFVGPGNLSFKFLDHISQQENMKEAMEMLSGTAYGPDIRRGYEAYRLSNQLSEFERYLNLSRLNWMASLINQDPLGIGLVLGFIALKVNEVNNLRWIANGINLSLKSADIQEQLEIAQ